MQLSVSLQAKSKEEAEALARREAAKKRRAVLAEVWKPRFQPQRFYGSWATAHAKARAKAHAKLPHPRILFAGWRGGRSACLA